MTLIRLEDVPKTGSANIWDATKQQLLSENRQYKLIFEGVWRGEIAAQDGKEPVGNFGNATLEVQGGIYVEVWFSNRREEQNIFYFRDRIYRLNL